MENHRMLNINENECRTLYDYNKEWELLLALGGFIVLKRSECIYILNILYVCWMYSLVIFLMAMAVITMISIDYEKTIRVQALHTLSLLIVALTTPTIKFLTRKSLGGALKLLRQGVFNYDGEEPDQEHLRFKVKRVGQAFLIGKWVVYMSLFSAFAFTFCIPILQYFTLKENHSDNHLNYYLPFRLYMPFNTKNLVGYGIAFLSNGMFSLYVYCVGIGLVNTYLGSAFQLIAQIEILIHSLKSIEKRAMGHLKGKLVGSENPTIESMYSDPEFQKAMYICLRTNALHHQAILRLSELLRPYMEGLNAMATLCFSLTAAACVVLIIVNPKNSIAFIAACLSATFCFHQLCFLGEMITEKSTDLRDALYLTPWYFMDDKFAVLLQIMMLRAERPIIYRATGFQIPSSLETFANMVSLGYKIVNLITI